MTAPLAVESQTDASGMLLGEHTAEILGALGYRAHEIKTLASKRVILLGNGA